MAMALIWILVLTSAGVIVVSLRRPEGAYQYPFLAAATFLGFIAPQLPAFAEDPFFAEGAVARTAAFATLCLLGCVLGWHLPRPSASTRRPWCFDEHKLLAVAAGLSLIGAYFYMKINNLPYDIKFSIYTGLPVVYIFFARLMPYGFAIALICFARRPSLPGLGVVAFDLVVYADRILVHGRRSEAADFVFLIALALWFQRRLAAPRLLSILFVLGAALALTSTGDYRSVTTARDPSPWSALLKIDVAANFEHLLAYGGEEVRNAINRMETVRTTEAYDFGLSHWNATAFNYVPAQLLGTHFKESLMVSLDGQIARDYAPHPGTTETGLTDAFASFSYLGALKFVLLAYLMRRLYDAAMRGSTACQIVYALSLSPSMHAITHHTQWPYSNWIHIGLFLLPALLLARTRTDEVRPAAATVPFSS
ncbi:hypothetical protein K32_20990 [Kaistia sp. 32K]|uniref:hypothetical protein n=1 Tax=Kaistia sp. 32K TaxID=2795690 RepID=UPI001915EF6C|nr:hypothetical protein [Kaistia sp. 32K]BCP53482.1 hypothetical protein K32_20990 [Kaistia sp. 32K]